MVNTIRRTLFSLPAAAIVGLFALYVALGFLALPSIVKWQVEKQVPAQLGHSIRIGDVHVNPLTLRFEVDDVALSDREGRSLLGFKRLLVNFELRSLIDRAWTFAQVTLESPALHLDVDKDGRHNFAALLERLRGSGESDQEAGALPRLVVQHLVLSDGRIEYSDRLLDTALVTRIEPLSIDIDHLSTLPDQRATYRLSAPTRAGESFESHGTLALNPLAIQGTLALVDLELATLVRGLSRWVAAASPAGKINLSTAFDLALGPNGTLRGSLRDLDLGIASLSFNAAGATTPLLAVHTLALKQGRVDLDQRQARFGSLRLAKGSVALSVDEQGGADWSTLVRAAAAPPREASAPATAPSAKPSPPDPWRVTLPSVQVSDLAIDLSDAMRGQSVHIASAGIDLSSTADFAPGRSRIELGQPKLSMVGARLEQGADSLDIPRAVVEAGRMAIVAADRGFELELVAPHLSAPEGLSARQRGAALALLGLDVQGSRFAAQGAGPLSTIAVDGPKVAIAGAQLNGEGVAAQLRDLALAGAQLSLRATADQADIKLEKVQGTFAELRATQGDRHIGLRSAQLASEMLSLVTGDTASRIAGSNVQASLSGLVARPGFGATAGQTATSDRGDITLASASANAKTLVFVSPAGAIDVTGDGMSLSLSDLVVNEPVDATELLRLGSADVAGAALRLRERLFAAEKVALARGAAKTWLDAQGRFNLLSLVAGAAEPQTSTDSAHASANDQTVGANWRATLKSVQLDGFAVGFEDRRLEPAFAIGAEVTRAHVADFDSASATPMQVDVQARLASGGELQAHGKVWAAPTKSDLTVKIAELALAPLQPYLSDLAELRLASGTLSGEGRVRYDADDGAKARLAYEGSVAVDRLSLEETQSKRPFLGWDSVASNDLALTLQPGRVDIGELRVTGPSGRLIIAADRTVNLTDVLKKPPDRADGPDAAAQRAARATPASEPGPESPALPVSIARVRVSGGALEFADLSLQPPFAARMHELKGVITGLGNDPNGRATLKLDARVDQFGAAKVRGQLSVLSPRTFTAIDMTFRNLEMPSLSPYVAKFAGYRIAAGRLAVDLQYKIRDGEMLGENKFVLNQVELGEKVESPDALNLPLELAIAILKDSDGVIDIGLPVRGNLEDPKFDYGAVVGKAFGKLLGGIASAPFKALGALFGGAKDRLGAIDFEPGSDVIAPPEGQKLQTVAHAMNERPALVLLVPPTYAAEEDAAELKSLKVRDNIFQQMGIEPTAGEDPGPIDVTNPRVQHAVETAFNAHFPAEVLVALKRRAVDAATPSQGPPAEFYQTLVDRLIAEEPISEATLEQLAVRRGSAVVRELTTVGGLPPSRVVLGPPQKASAASEDAVTLRLRLEVAK